MAKYNREFTFLPFGVGPRNCLGMKFAMMQIKMALFSFFKKFKVSPSKLTEVPLTMKRGVNRLQPLNGVYLTVEKRS
ncbi:Thromboxane-A synthase [Chamberlinius hualienensis]